MGKCVKLAVQGKQIADKYFEGKASFQAYYKEIGNVGRALNVNLIDYNGGVSQLKLVIFYSRKKILAN